MKDKTFYVGFRMHEVHPRQLIQIIEYTNLKFKKTLEQEIEGN